MAKAEERNFTKAEMKLFSAKYEVFQAAQKDLDQFVVFLREQHEIEGTDWQIGQNGFFRLESPAVPDAGTSTPDVKKDEKVKRESE